jgi:hypothetical protein
MGIQGQGAILNSQTSAYNADQNQADPFGSILGMGLGAMSGGVGTGLAKKFFS